MTQIEQVITVLKSQPLTQMQANALGISRLAARINYLRNRGVAIHSEQIAVKKANGKMARVAVYSMAG